MLENIVTLLMLVALQAVLGFDNLLYISLEAKRVPEAEQAKARNIGIGLAIMLRIGLLFAVLSVIELLKDPFFTIPENAWVKGAFSVHSLIVLAGGGFIIYTAIKEVFHMMAIDKGDMEIKNPKSLTGAVISIVIMNLVFSFDSILSAIALTKVFWVMALAIVIGGILMVVFSGKISDFLKKNRTYEVLGLFILLVVGILLVTEGGELSGLYFFDYKIEAMSKSTFYFVIAVMVITDIAQGRYLKKLASQKTASEG